MFTSKSKGTMAISKQCMLTYIGHIKYYITKAIALHFIHYCVIRRQLWRCQVSFCKLGYKRECTILPILKNSNSKFHSSILSPLEWNKIKKINKHKIIKGFYTAISTFVVHNPCCAFSVCVRLSGLALERMYVAGIWLSLLQGVRGWERLSIVK